MKSAAIAALALASLALLFGASKASADISFCPQGEGAGQCGAPEVGDNRRDLAVDGESGRLYVADEPNNRIDVFAQDGDFLFAFGWKVNATAPEEKLQTCTTATGCLKGTVGAGAGQIRRPASIAVDSDPASPSYHDIYVGEAGNFQGAGGQFRVQKFDPTGAFVWMLGKGVDKTDGGDLCTQAEAHTCGAGAESAAEGGFASEVFVASGPGGVLYAVDEIQVSESIVKQRLQRFQPSGAPIPPQAFLFEGFAAAPFFITVDAVGDLWISGSNAGRGLRKYSPTGALLAGPFEPKTNFFDLAIDAVGDLYAAQLDESGSFNVIASYDPTGKLLHRFAYTDRGAGFARIIEGLAAHTSAFGEFFFSQRSGGITYVSEPPPGPVIATPSVEAKAVGNARATLFAEVNPEGKETEVHFDFVDEATYLQDIADLGPGHGFDHAKSTSTEALGAADFELKASEALAGCPQATKALIEEGKCLRPETPYRFRAIATNADGEGSGPVEGEPFTTRAPLEFGDTYATAVGPDAATLHAELNPLGIPTTAHFQYVDDASFQASGFAEATELPSVATGAAPLDFGQGEAISARAATAYPLAPATTYHYRLIATDPLLAAPLIGPERVFTTTQSAAAQSCPANEASRIGPGALLPDCRAYEIVSPLDKAGGDIRVLEGEVGSLSLLEQSSDSGERLAYNSVRAFGDAVSAPYTSQYIAQRLAGVGWQTHSINSSRDRPVVGVLAQFNPEFEAFSADLCEAWQITYAEPPLAAGGQPGYRNLYRRRDRLCGEEGYEALAPIAVPEALPSGGLAGGLSDMELQGLSADGSGAIFLAAAKLAPGASESGKSQLYLSAVGAPPLPVCILPDGAASISCAAGSLSPNGEQSVAPGKISADGSRIFWSDASGGLYLRGNPAAPESARLHGAASGKGTLIGPATGTGNVVSGSELVKNANAVSGGFAVGQQIGDSNGSIPAATTITAIEETKPALFTLTLSTKAVKTKLGDALIGAASASVPALLTETGAFEAGQQISGLGIPPDTTVLSCSPSCGLAATSVTLSALATKTKAEAALAATSPCTEAQAKACTVVVSEATEAAAGGGKSRFWGAAVDGSKAIFTTRTGPEASSNTLYSFEPEGEVTTLLAEGVYGVMGIGEDAGRIYFASAKVLSGEEANSNGDKAEAGKANLYLYEADEAGGSTRFIGTLAGGDLDQDVFAVRYGLHTARLSPDGATAAFTSIAPLTGYDNKSATDGGPTREVYLYDAEAGQLICASCNPSGARPAGPAEIPPFRTATHAARVIAAGGARLYFESADPLVARDTNGAVDVYQWEAPGAGTCTSKGPTYSALNQGCIELISSGQSPVDSRFVEATPGGGDVFFATLSSLLPQDPGLIDIYDARVDGGLPIPSPPAPACEGEACQSPPAPPNDPTPASSAFEGAGNVEEAESKPRPCKKGKVRSKGKCVRKHPKAKHKRHRANPDRRAAR